MQGPGWGVLTLEGGKGWVFKVQGESLFFRARDWEVVDWRGRGDKLKVIFPTMYLLKY